MSAPKMLGLVLYESIARRVGAAGIRREVEIDFSDPASWLENLGEDSLWLVVGHHGRKRSIHIPDTQSAWLAAEVLMATMRGCVSDVTYELFVVHKFAQLPLQRELQAQQA